MNFQWYPGHMTKAKRQMQEDIKLIDLVIELVDARIPLSSRNPDIDELGKNKYRLILMNKADLADRKATEQWSAFFKKKGYYVVSLDARSKNGMKSITDIIMEACKEKMERDRKRGIKNRPVRAMVVGIPNVGKSTFINRIAGAARAQVGDRPGVTRSKQWVKVSDYLELLDTPGLLWGKLDNEILAKHLAYIGSIRDDVLDIEEISALLLFDLVRICPEALTARYKKLDPEQNIPELLLEGVCRSRGFILSGGVFDTERVSRIVLDEYRAGKIAAVALENPTDNFEPQQAEQTDINNEKD